MQEGSKAVAKSYGKCREFVTFFLLCNRLFNFALIEDEVVVVRLAGQPLTRLCPGICSELSSFESALIEPSFPDKRKNQFAAFDILEREDGAAVARVEKIEFAAIGGHNPRFRCESGIKRNLLNHCW